MFLSVTENLLVSVASPTMARVLALTAGLLVLTACPAGLGTRLSGLRKFAIGRAIGGTS